MAKLENIICSQCGQLIESDEYMPNKRAGASAATSFYSCLRRCEQCGIGYSNTKNLNSVVKIYRNLLDNIPPDVQDGARETLANSLNKINKNNKKAKFGFETSEDAVSWTVFSHLQKNKIIRESLKVLTVEWLNQVTKEPSLLLWGVPVPNDDQIGNGTRKKLIKVLNEIGEDSKKFSEPDVIMDFGDFGIVIIEVKYRSPNDILNSNSPKWDKYILDTDAFLNINGIKESGCYELARNWRIAWDLAGGRSMALLNLGPDSIFKRNDGKKLREFSKCLRQNYTHKFGEITWTRFLEGVLDPPQWFNRYLKERDLLA